MRPRKATHASQSTLFLIELIISVAFMALSSTVCVRLYLYAHELSADSAFRTHAVTEVQNAFTAFRTGSGSPEDTLNRFLETVSFSGQLSRETVSSAVETVSDYDAFAASSVSSGNAGSVSILLSFDNSWNLTGYDIDGTTDDADSSESAPYRLTLTWSEETGTPGMEILTADLRDDRMEQNERAYQAECRRYCPEHTAVASSEGKSSAPAGRTPAETGKEATQ